jgi:hypothetical protein
MLFETVGEDEEQYIPPPSLPAPFPLTVLLDIAGEDDEKQHIPPP